MNIADNLITDLSNKTQSILTDEGTTIGVGLDLVDVTEFERMDFTANIAFYERCFSPDEIAYCLAQAVPARHFAARFAAKEAAVKAFSSIAALAYRQVEVRHSENSAPYLYLSDYERHGPLTELAQYEALVSLSHTDNTAGAVVIVYESK